MYSSRVAHVHGNALTCSIPSMVEGSPSRTAHVWLTCTVMPSHVAFPQWWRGALSRTAHMWLTCMVMPSRVAFLQWWRGAPHIQLTYSRAPHVWLTCTSRVAHVHGNALACSISSMVEGSPSHTAPMWLTCTVMPSRVAFPQRWRGAPHIQLTCGSHVAHVHSNALMCSIPSMVKRDPSHTAHVLTCGSHAQ